MTGRREGGARRHARETALAVLYSEEFGGRGDLPSGLAELLDLEAGPPAYALVLVEGVHTRRAELDERIRLVSHHWRLERMSLIDRNVIRLAAFEILFVEDVSSAVAINEAIEIARRYGDTDSWSFVNGVLDAVARGVP